MSDKQSRNFQSFNATLERMRNDSLRLNAGVQTEGDAIRAYKELIDNINDPEVVTQRLDELGRLYDRTTNQKVLDVEMLYRNHGLEVPDLSKYMSPGAVVGGQDKGQSQTIPKTNANGWTLHQDAKGNKAYVSPDGKQFEEVH